MVNILIFNSKGVLLEKSATPDTFYGKINNLINPFHMCQKNTKIIQRSPKSSTSGRVIMP